MSAAGLESGVGVGVGVGEGAGVGDGDGAGTGAGAGATATGAGALELEPPPHPVSDPARLSMAAAPNSCRAAGDLGDFAVFIPKRLAAPRLPDMRRTF